MTTNLRNLIWAGMLVGWLALMLDWRDATVKLRPERIQAEQLRTKEQSILWSVDWNAALVDAQDAKLRWLERLPLVDQVGVFRAQALENISDLCKKIEASCQVSPMGENLTSVNNSTNGNIAGLVSTGVRVTVPMQGNKLELLMRTIENDYTLRRINKLSSRGALITVDVETFGLNSKTLTATKFDLLGNSASKLNFDQLRQ
jgi:hypothetical protein